MEIGTWAIRLTNITVVYDKLNTDELQVDALRRGLIPEHLPVIAQIPENILVLQYPKFKIVCRFGEQRVRVDDLSGAGDSGNLLPEVITRAVALLPQHQHIAYGFNYIVAFSYQGIASVGQFFNQQLLAHPTAVERQMGAQIVSAGLRLRYTAQDVLYDLRLDEEDQPQIALAHLNAHFLNQSLPAEAELRHQFSGELAQLRTLLERLV